MTVARNAGVWNTTLSYDHQPGGTGRHLQLETSRLAIGKRKPGECPLVGKIRLSQSGLRLPGAGMQVVIGTSLSVTAGNPIQVTGRAIASEVTDESGRFSTSLKPGTYGVLFWKSGYKIDGPHTLTVPDTAEVNRTLLHDRSANPNQTLKITDLDKAAAKPPDVAKNCPRCGIVTKFRDTPMCTKCISVVLGDLSIQRHAESKGQKRIPREKAYWQYLPKSARR